MPRSANPQLNVRSRYARERAAELARATGMTATQVVEEALRAFIPPPGSEVPQGLVRRGKLLVLKAQGPAVTQAQSEAAIEAVRTRVAP